MIYYSDQQTCIIYIQKRKFTYIAAEGYLSSEHLKLFIHKLTEFVIRHKPEFVLFDTSKLEILRIEDINWIKGEVYSKFKCSSIHKIGFIKPVNIFGDVSLNNLIPKNSIKEIQKFNSIEAAEQWVLSNSEKAAS